MKKGDKLIFSVILIITVVGFLGTYFYKNFTKSKDTMAVIKQDGKVIKEIDFKTLDKEEEFIIYSADKKHYNKIVATKDGVYISEADCPDQVCVKTGIISEVGDTVVCLPFRLMIAIEGEKANKEIDATTY
ncbi:MAG: NusG domain II-containing protein [Clostridiaceae bacterium]